ncbi:hypothetical protein JCM17380_24820 [Desulfosporosinus burensis]
MLSQTLLDVSQYITDNIYHSTIWDESDDTQRGKAINNSIDLLILGLKGIYTSETDIPINILAHQTIWFMRIDDTFLRAEMGASYIQMSGVMVNIKDKDRSIAPYVMDALGITPDPLTGGVTKRKVGSYSGRKVGTPESLYRREQ